MPGQTEEEEMLSTITSTEPMILNEAAIRGGATVQKRISLQPDGTLKKTYITTFHKPKPIAPPKPEPLVTATPPAFPKPEPPLKPKSKKKPRKPRKKKKKAVARDWGDDDDPLRQKKGIQRGGPDECAVCGGMVYTNGNCFKCGTFLPGGNRGAPGSRKDAYEYLQMSYDIRINNHRWRAFGRGY